MLIQAAKYLQVAPWELEEKGVAWMYQGLNAMQIDATESERVKQRRERRNKSNQSSIRRIR